MKRYLWMPEREQIKNLETVETNIVTVLPGLLGKRRSDMEEALKLLRLTMKDIKKYASVR